jgi:hypothetical protein
MTEGQDTQMKSATEARLATVGLDLREALVPIIREIAGPSPRPSRLAERLEIDKSLASKLSRAYRTEDPLEFMHTVPAPAGLRIFLSAAARAKVPSAMRTSANRSIRRFQALIDETPGGRATLNAAISASSPEARQRNEQTSKQAVFRAMSYLLGIQCDSMASTFIIRPGEAPDMVDSIDISQRTAMRRLRPTAPVGLLSHRLHGQHGEEDVAELRFETLDGKPADDVRSFFLPGFCSDPLPDMQEFKNGNQTTIALTKSGPPPEEPFNLTFAAILRNVLERYRLGENEHGWRNYLLHCPCKTLVRDVFIRDDLYVGTVPEITLYIPSPKGPEIVKQPGEFGTMNTLDMATPMEQLGMGLARVGVKEIPSYTGMLRHVFDRAGWDASRYRGYRTRIIYPVPMVYMNWWFKLPEPPK